MRIALLGPPGSGKGTLGIYLQEELRIPFLSTGDVLREMARRGVVLGSVPLSDILDRGELVSSKDIVSILGEKIDDMGIKSLIIDGFPRSLEQIKLLDSADWAPELYIYLRIPRYHAVRRLLGRRVHVSSGRSYHIVFNPPKKDGLDDVTGELLTIRSDDSAEVIEKRMDADEERTAPVIEFLKSSDRYKLLIIDGNRGLKEVHQSALEEIQKYLKSR